MSSNYERMPEEKDICTRQQINQCLMDIQDLHPLAERAKFDHIIPQLQWLRCCLPRRKPDFNFALRQALLKEMKIKMPKSEMALMEDPFLILGYGVNAYFDMILSLFYLFVLITIFMLPMFYAFSQNPTKALKNESKYLFNQFSLGNLGGSSVSCTSRKLRQQDIYLECPAGIMSADAFTFGVMPADMEHPNYCTEEAMWADKINIDKHKCTDHMDRVKILNNIKSACHGKSSCSFSFKDWTVAGTDPKLITGNGALCGDSATFFVQTPCMIQDHERIIRKICGLVAGCLIVFVYLFVMTYFDYVKSVQTCKFIDQDVNTITAGDYSVEFNIKDSTYERFRTVYYDKTNPMSEPGQFKLYVQDELERRINQIPDQGYDEPEERHKKKKIAQISFAYENTQIIEWLQERGTLIKFEKWEKLKDLEDKIADGITHEGPLLDKLQLPCSVFVTWETEEGNGRALQYNDECNPQMDLLGEQIIIEDASEPSDIIWENRQYSEFGRHIKRAIVWTIIMIALSISAAIIYKFTLISNAAKFRFPPANCDQVFNDYASLAKRIKGFTAEELWTLDSLQEYHQNYQLVNAGKPTHYKDAMQCFCKQLSKISPSSTKDTNFQAELVFDGKPVQYSKPICRIYQNEMIQGKVYGQAVSFVIIAVNLILKTLIIKLIIWVREDTESQQLASITNGVFVAQFFNTGFLLLLVNANMDEYEPRVFTQHFNGPFHDYMPQWYSAVGMKIVQTMLINSILPYVGVATGWAIPALKKKLDRSFGSDVYQTKKTSMAMYKALYSGPEYVIHFKYSGILNITFITMMYGTGLPILFPIAAFNFFNQWVCERIIVAKQVQQPPVMDDKLTKNCIEKMMYAPLLLLCNGYWMLSNYQIFENAWSYIPDNLHGMKSNHFVLLRPNHASPMLYMALAAVFLIIFTKTFSSKLQEWGFAMQAQDITVDEDLPTFYSAIKLKQADELVLQERNMMEHYGIQLQDPCTIEKLDETKMPKKAMMGTPWYTVLSNATYQGQFNYIGAFIGEREKLIEDGLEDEILLGKMTERCVRSKCSQSDMVVLLLNLSCIPDSVVRKIDFEAGWQSRFKKNMEAYQKLWENDGKIWKFQDTDLETKYLAFKDKAQEEDIVFQSEKARIETQKAVGKAFQKKKNSDDEDVNPADSFKRMETTE